MENETERIRENLKRFVEFQKYSDKFEEEGYDRKGMEEEKMKTEEDRGSEDYDVEEGSEVPYFEEKMDHEKELLHEKLDPFIDKYLQENLDEESEFKELYKEAVDVSLPWEEGAYFENTEEDKRVVTKHLEVLDNEIEDIFKTEEGIVAMIDGAPVNLSMEYEELDEEYIERLKEINKSNLETAWEWLRERHELGFECEVPEMNTQEFVDRFLKFKGNGVLRVSAGKYSEYDMEKENLEPEDFGVHIEKFDLHF